MLGWRCLDLLQLALLAASPGDRFLDRLSQDADDAVHLLLRDDERRGEEEAIAEVAADQALLLRQRDDTGADSQLYGERLVLLLVVYELDAGDQADAAHLADAVLAEQRPQSVLQLLAHRGRVLDEAFLLHNLEVLEGDGASGRVGG